MDTSRTRSFAALLALLALGACAPLSRAPAAPSPATLRASLDSIFADSVFAHAHWGVEVRSLEDGDVLYQQNSEKLFVPASNMKLVTGAAVLEALGPEYRYRTTVAAGGPITDGVLRGPLVVWGSGDPTLSTRFAADARAVFRAWADSLQAHGVTRIEGAIIGVDSSFTDPPLGAGWAWDDLDAYYAAEVTGLQLNEGVIDIRVFPGRSLGEPGVVVLDPPTQYVRVVNQTVTTGPGTEAELSISREPVGPTIEITGQVPVDTALERTLAVRNPTGYFVNVLRETLREAGILVEGPAVDLDEWPDLAAASAAPLFVHTSPPLREILPAMMKPSQNWIAETLLRTLGRELRGEGSAEAGAAAVDSLFQLWGLDTHALRMADGSGLSRYDLVSPELLIGLLAHMTRSPHWELWYASLPVAGVDGTLRNRLEGTPAEGNVHAKTGTLTGVRALSGYVTTAGEEPLIFSTLVNHHVLSSRDADRLIDAMLVRLASWPR